MSGQPSAIYETVLYGPDVRELARFYTEAIGLRLVEIAPDGLFAACRIGDGGMLLLFDPEAAAAPGRRVPAHGATGPGHIAFRVAGDELDEWRERFAAHGIAVERVVEWEPGVESLYVRDPAGNSVELAGGELWEPPASP
jgi:catechol 2,3-dioxygenase-like lactoylglutathione lyase family enzyme